MNAAEPIACRRVILVRHGHFERTPGLTDTSWGLSPLGRRQAVKAGHRLTRIVESANGSFEGVYASPWPRASQTAEIAARELALPSVKVKPYLHEVVPLVDPDRCKLELFPPGLERTGPSERDAAHRQVQRVRARFFRPARKSSLVLLFTHGNLVRYLVTRVLGLPYESWASMDVAHCGLTELRVYPNGFEALIHYNDTGHLPPSMITTS
jgi:broad specificity phosphatase PhoE